MSRKVIVKWSITCESGTWSRSAEEPVEVNGYLSALAEDFERAVELFKLRELRYEVARKKEAE